MVEIVDGKAVPTRKELFVRANELADKIADLRSELLMFEYENNDLNFENSNLRARLREHDDILRRAYRVIEEFGRGPEARALLLDMRDWRHI